jgi:hypothetical protein
VTLEEEGLEIAIRFELVKNEWKRVVAATSTML